MSDDIRSAASPHRAAHAAAGTLVPLQVGDATVYIEPSGPIEVADSDDIRPVVARPADAFREALEVLSECVRVTGQQLQQIAEALRPDELTVEFTIDLEVEGKARIVPVLLTGKATTSGGFKVTAKWETS